MRRLLEHVLTALVPSPCPPSDDRLVDGTFVAPVEGPATTIPRGGVPSRQAGRESGPESQAGPPPGEGDEAGAPPVRPVPPLPTWLWPDVPFNSRSQLHRAQWDQRQGVEHLEAPLAHPVRRTFAAAPMMLVGLSHAGREALAFTAIVALIVFVAAASLGWWLIVDSVRRWRQQRREQARRIEVLLRADAGQATPALRTASDAWERLAAAAADLRAREDREVGL